MADNRYNYSYPIILTPLRSDMEIDFTSDEAKTAIMQGVAEYNKSATVSRTCPKEIVDVIPYKRQIAVTLVATDVIKSPGRALRTLSLKLLKYEYFKKLVTDDHKLFTTVYEKFDDENEKEDDGISNEILLKCAIDVVFAPANTVTNSALNEFKDLCLKYHLVEKYL